MQTGVARRLEHHQAASTQDHTNAYDGGFYDLLDAFEAACELEPNSRQISTPRTCATE